VRELSPLSTLENLEIVHMNATQVSSLEPLKKLKKLQKVYCDRSLIKQSQAEALRAASPNVLVVFDSDDLSNWWNSLSDAWKAVIMKTLAVQSAPSKESLAVLDKIDSINLTGGAGIMDLEPLSKFPRLKKVYAAGTSINDLTPLSNQTELVYLDVSGTGVSSLSPITKLTKLKTIRADRSKIVNMEWTCPALENLYADGTAVDDAVAKNFLLKNPKSLLVYKTEKLKAWWSNLPAGWRDIFKEHIHLKGDATTEDLHRLVELEALEAKDAPVSDFVPLGEFVRLRQLHLTGTAMNEVVVTPGIQSLTSLHLKGGPLINTESLAQLTDLEDLDISNTPVEDIYPLWKLKKLKKLNCAGTKIKHLNALEKMEGLEFFDCSNTNVNKLDVLNNLPLKNLKCFNTRLSSKAVERFRQSHPDCSVQYY
jgi:Leucine-rich repeat (LRR) protein